MQPGDGLLVAWRTGGSVVPERSSLTCDLGAWTPVRYSSCFLPNVEVRLRGHVVPVQQVWESCSVRPVLFVKFSHLLLL